MPTRLYLTNSAPSYTPTTKQGAWDTSTATLARQLGGAPSGTATTAAVSDGTSATNNLDFLLGRWISDPIAKSGTLSGMVAWIMGVLESSANMNAFFHLHIYVTQGDSDTPRGTVLTDSIGGTEWATAATGRGEGAKALTSLACTAGDRVVVEVGYRVISQVTPTTSYTGTIHYGNTGATDLASGGTGGTNGPTVRPGWIEFSDPAGVLRHPVEFFRESFNDNSIDTAKWPFFSGATTVAETGAHLEVTAKADNSFGYLEALSQYALAGSSLTWYMAPPSAQNSVDFANARMTFYDVTPGIGNTYLTVYVSSVSGEFGWFAQLAGVPSIDVSYTPGGTSTGIAAGGWYRITESAGTLSLYASTDGLNFGLVDTATTPAWLTASNRLTIDCEAVRSVASADGTPAVFDNVNILLAGSLTDDFDDNSIDTTLWSANFGTVAESGGSGQVTHTTGGSGYGSQPIYTLQNSSALAKVTLPAAGAATSMFAGIGAYLDVPTYLTVVRVYANVATGELTLAYSDPTPANEWEVNTTYDPVAHAWLRLRESGGTVYGDTSPDGRTWTATLSHATPTLALTVSTVELDFEAYRVGGTDAVTAFDNINLPPEFIDVAGTASALLGALTGHVDGVRKAAGSAAAGLGLPTATAAGPVTVGASAVAGLGGLTASAAAVRATAGTAVADLGRLEASGAATGVKRGAASAELGELTAAAGADVTVRAGASATFGFTAEVAAVRGETGQAEALLGGLQAHADGTPDVNAAAAAVLGGLVSAVEGTPASLGAVSAELGQLSAHADGMGAGTVLVAAQLGALTGLAAGVRRNQGQAAAVLGALAAAVSGRPTSVGGSAALLGGLTAVAAGGAVTPGFDQGHAQLGGLSASVFGARLVAAVAHAQLGQLAAYSMSSTAPINYPLHAGDPVCQPGHLHAGEPVVASPW